MTEARLQVIPLGGVGEFGKNMTAIRFNDDIIVIDAGAMFPEDELLGIDVVIPDFTYLEQNRERISALILTHGHEDHIGAVPFLLAAFDVPVYATPLTLALLTRHLTDRPSVAQPRLHAVAPADTVTIGPFRIEFIHVTHSILSALAVAITTPLGVIVHTGDFKIDATPTDERPFDIQRFAEYGQEGVLLLLSDSTNADVPGHTPTERAIRPRFEELFVRAKRRLFVSCFSTSLPRIQQTLDVAKQFDRKVALVGRSIQNVCAVASQEGALHVPDGLLVAPSEVRRTPPDRLAVIISGSQGQPMAALGRAAVNENKQVSIEQGDIVVISARLVPGAEKAIYRMADHLTRRGAEVVLGSMNPPLHVSGHASADELRFVLNTLRPRFFAPIHGDYRHLSLHASLASHLRGNGLDDIFVLDAGDTLEITEHGARLSGRVAVGRVCIDSGSIDEVVEELVIRDRRRLSMDGIVLAIVVVNKHTGSCEKPPEIVTRGFALSEEHPEFLETARQVVVRSLEESSQEERMDWGVLKEQVRSDLKRYISKQSRRRPLIMPVILEI